MDPEVVPDQRYRADQTVSDCIQVIPSQMSRSVGAPSIYGAQNQSCITAVMRLWKVELPIQLLAVV